MIGLTTGVGGMVLVVDDWLDRSLDERMDLSEQSNLEATSATSGSNLISPPNGVENFFESKF